MSLDVDRSYWSLSGLREESNWACVGMMFMGDCRGPLAMGKCSAHVTGPVRGGKKCFFFYLDIYMYLEVKVHAVNCCKLAMHMHFYMRSRNMTILLTGMQDIMDLFRLHLFIMRILCGMITQASLKLVLYSGSNCNGWRVNKPRRFKEKRKENKPEIVISDTEMYTTWFGLLNFRNKCFFGLFFF